VTLGPCTNLALALRMDPELSSMIHKYYMMGGTCKGYGNISLTGEYNLWADPEAAKIVRQEIKYMHVVPWEPADELKLTFKEADEMFMKDGHDQVLIDGKLNPLHLFYKIN
jgi:purine nucleosidase